MHMIQELTVSEKGTGAEIRPAVVSAIATGNAPVSYWLMLFVPYSYEECVGTHYRIYLMCKGFERGLWFIVFIREDEKV